MTTKQIVYQLTRIQNGIDGDSFTWENIESLKAMLNGKTV